MKEQKSKNFIKNEIEDKKLEKQNQKIKNEASYNKIRNQRKAYKE